MRTSIVAASLALLAASACSSAPEEQPARSPEPPPAPAPAPPPQAQPDAPKLEPVACRFMIPKSVEGKTVRCADLQVPENRRSQGSRTITIHVAVVAGKPGGVPTIELMGGPGGGSDDLVGPLAAREPRMLSAYEKILDNGDLVLFDQRGVGRSIPRLTCAGAPEDAQGEAPEKCAARLAAAGVDVVAYDTVENADDVHDLARALGAPKVDLHGISYGTRLALEVVKRHPEDVRAAIVDGVMPPDVKVTGGFNLALDAIVTKIFGTCKADTKCNATYADLEDKLLALKAKLDATPFQVVDPGWGTFPYDWRAFVDDLMMRLYQEGEAARVPFRIGELLAQDQAAFQAARDAEAAEIEKVFEEEAKVAAQNPAFAELLARYDGMSEDDYEAVGLADGMYLSVTCNDYVQHESRDDALAALAKIRPALRDDAMLEDELAMCDGWPKRPSDPGLRAPAAFAGPTLVIGGVFDPATPYTWAERASSALPNDRLVIVPTGGHGLMDACGAGLKGSFLADPSRPLDAACATSRTLDFYYAAPKSFAGGAHHTARRAASPVFTTHAKVRPAGAARTTLERIEQRVIAAMARRP